MLKLTQIKIPAAQPQDQLEKKICALLRIPKSALKEWRIVRRSIEARKQEPLSYVYSVEVSTADEARVLRKNRNRNITAADPVVYTLPECGHCKTAQRPVVIGSGPAGLFCAYLLALRGFSPVVLERGEAIEERKRSVEAFWETGVLNPESNVQFGEGGAGTFSDGKLNTGIRDASGRIGFVLQTFADCGAAREILYDARPHVGTDVLYDVVRELRRKIIALGGSFFFSAKVSDIAVRDGQICGVALQDGTKIETGICVAAIGHSARDTVRMLFEKGVFMQPKAFAVGVRIQHPQALINRAQWGEAYPKKLGAAPYSLSAKTADGRGVYTFCMCPGGYVVNASSETGHLAVNGMSYSGRGSGFANGAVIAGVNPPDYLKYRREGTPEALCAIDFQRMLERRAYQAADGAIPVQRLEDFAAGRISGGNGFAPCTKGNAALADVRGIFPAYIADDLCAGISDMGKRLAGFDLPDALLMGVESRTSSPVRMQRSEETCESGIRGLYPCGEGAGYAGGIVSAAADGMKVAENIIKKWTYQ